MYVIEISYGTPEYDNTIRLRDKILKSPLGITFDEDEINREYQHFHLACYSDDADLLGCLVLEGLDDKQLKMRQVAVDEPFQNQGIGTLLVAESEVFAKEKSFATMVLNARDTSIPFYTRLKYKKVGKAFTEVGIKHYKMTKKM